MLARLRRRVAPLSVAAILAGTPASASPTPEAKAAAEALFREGVELVGRGAHARACPKFAEAVRLTEGEALGGLLELARCYEHIGRTASAWALYREVAAKAATSGQADRQREATAGAGALEPRLHALALVVEPALEATPGLSIRRGGVDLGRAVWALATPVDPGEVVIEVRAPGKHPSTRTVVIPQTPGTTRVVLRALDDAALVSPRAGAPAESAFWGKGRIGGAVIAGAGLSAMGLSLGLVLAAKADYDDAFSSGLCDASGTCGARGKAQTDAARSLGNVSTAVFVAGAVTAAGGAVLFLASGAPSRSGAAPSPFVIAAGGAPGAFDVRLAGRF
jgi:hypothetical protein